MTDNVNHPTHYTDGWSNGAEVIDITENLDFNRGNAVKYIARAGKKDPEKELEDLQKAEFYLKREIQRVLGTAPSYQVVPMPDLTDEVSQFTEEILVGDKTPEGLHPSGYSITDFIGFAGNQPPIQTKSFWDEVFEALTPVAEAIVEAMTTPSQTWFQTAWNIASSLDQLVDPPKPEPRVVDVLTLDDVIDSTAWTDVDGDFLKLEGDKWWRKYTFPGAEWFVVKEAEDIDYELSYMATDFGPYTEVLEPA